MLLEYFDTSFRNVADVENKLNLPVLGVIPHVAEITGAVHDPSSPEGEPYRVLQTNLNLALRADKSTALVVLSSGPGEGKSTTLRQLALCMAASGEKSVLLIDSDVRRPTQHKLGDLPRDPGLTDIVLNKVAWDRRGAARQVRLARLHPRRRRRQQRDARPALREQAPRSRGRIQKEV